jgi:hypothetical protein
MTIILRLIWPYLLRHLMNQGAGYTANYLQARRERRETLPEPPEDFETYLEEITEEVDELPVSEILICPSDSKPFLASDAFWFTLSGILLGSVVSIVLTRIFRPGD